MAKKFSALVSVAGAVLLALPTLGNAQDITLGSAGADVIWSGVGPGMRAGFHMDLGDLSGDGRRDLVIGSPGSGSLTGAVYVIFGGPQRTGTPSLSTADVVVSSTASGNLFGYSTALGNVISLEGANPRDLVVGAPGANGGRGAVYVFSAGTGWPTGTRLTDSAAAYVILGAPGDQLGSALATGDLDKDGHREIVIGAPGNNRVYVIKGSASLSGTLDLSVSPAARTYTAPGIGNVLICGDVTGDGIYDLLVGAPSQNVVFGYVGSAGTIPSTPTMSFSGVNTGDEAGTSIRILDIDADGKSDLVISAPGGDGPNNSRTNAGNVYVFLGPVTAAAHSLSEANIVFYGSAAGNRAGDKMVTGDINRDTPNDLVILESGALSGAGQLDIYYGRDRSTIGTLVGTQRVVDLGLAGQVSRHIFGDPTLGPIGSVQTYEVTGEGARDVIAGIPSQNSSTGDVYFTISPDMKVSPQSLSLTVNNDNSVTSSTPISLTNSSIVVIGWQATSNVAWLTGSPSSGSIDATHPGTMYLTASPAGAPPGVYNAIVNISSTSPDLIMTLPINVAVTVTGAKLSIDTPVNGATVSNGFTISGWAIDTGAASGTGVSGVDAYAYPSSGSPIYLGSASYGAARSDVASAYGAQFTNSGYSLTVSNLTPGQSYTIGVFVRLASTGAYGTSKAIAVTVASTSPAPTAGPTDPNPTPPPAPSGPTSPTGPTADTRVTVNRTALYFGSTSGGAMLSPAQTVTVSFTAGSDTWTATSNVAWLTITPASGSGAGTFSVALKAGTYGGTQSGTITVTAPGVANSPLTIPVQLTSITSPSNPIGLVDTPADNASGVVGAIPVTGWAVDDIGVTKVTLWRDPIAGEPTSSSNGKVFIGNAVQVDGARPDVTSTYQMPLNYQAGWGYLLLTNMLPNQGNGTFKLYVYANDVDGHTLLLGSRTITCDNAHATKPFGSIDTPDQGGNVSGSAYVNFGWALTPQPNLIPTDGSTINVFVDGVPIGHPIYNQSRSDIQTLFPGYANTNGAVGYLQFDSTRLANGVHTIAWGVTDNAGNSQGIGSRYFSILNGGAASTLAAQSADTTAAPAVRTSAPAVGPSAGQPASSLDPTPTAPQPAYTQNGYSPDAPLQVVDAPDAAPLQVNIEELGLLHVTIGPAVSNDADGYEGYLVTGDQLQPLPAGSFLDRKTGEFFWQPGVGFVGWYDFVFVRTGDGAREKIPVSVQITPRKHDNEMLLPSRTVRYPAGS